jgi:2'-5' RNA ligase
MSTQFAKKSQTQPWRCFVALPLDEARRHRLSQLQDAVQRGLPEDARKALRFTPSQSFHLTLRFLGDVPFAEIDALQAAVFNACHDAAPFTLRLAEPGCFPNLRNPRVVWAGVDGDLDALRALQLRVTQETATFGEPPETRTFQPHLTLARVNTRDRRVAHLIGQSVQQLVAGSPRDAHDSAWDVREVHLIRSELLPGGSHYTTLASFPVRPSTT